MFFVWILRTLELRFSEINNKNWRWGIFKTGKSNNLFDVKELREIMNRGIGYVDKKHGCFLNQFRIHGYFVDLILVLTCMLISFVLEINLGRESIENRLERYLNWKMTFWIFFLWKYPPFNFHSFFNGLYGDGSAASLDAFNSTSILSYFL